MISVIIFSVLIAQSSASFFNEFTRALGSIESKVGKLITDVGTDLRDTYDCTIDAVEKIIYDKDQIPKYYDKCKETSTKSSAVVAVKDAPQTITIYVKPVVSGSSKDDITTKNDDAVIDTDPKEIYNKKLVSVEQVVNNEYYRVDNMSSHLEHEFDGLSKNVDEKLRLLEKEKEDLHRTLLEIKNLHLEEEMQIEKTKEELRKVFDEILKKMNSSTKESDLRSEMNEAIRNIEKNSSKTILEEIEKWKEKGIEQLKDLQKIETNSTNQNATESKIPHTFKELAAKISKKTSFTLNSNKESSTRNSSVSSKMTVTPASPAATDSSIELVSRALSPSTVSSETLATEALSASNTISSTESVTRSFTDPTSISKKTITQTATAATTIYTTAVTSAPNTHSTLGSMESVTQSSTVATTTTFPSTITTLTSTETTTISPDPVTWASTVTTTNSAEPVIQASISVTTTSTELTTQASTVTTATSPESVTRASTVTTTTSAEPVTRGSTVTTTNSTKPVTWASTVTTTTSQEPVSQASITDATTYIELTTQASTETIATFPEQVTRASTVTTTTSGEPVTQALTVTTTTSGKPLTVITTTTEQVTRASIVPLFPIKTKKPTPKTVATVTASIEPGTRPAYTMNRNHGKIPSRNNRFKYSTPKHNLKITSSTPEPFNNVDKIVPKSPLAAYAEALKIFSNSMRKKTVLDNFFKKVDSVPTSQVF